MPDSTRYAGRSFALALLTTFSAFAALYAPQPLLPFFAEHYAVSPTHVALLITVTMVALAIAPLGIGVWLQRYSAQRLLVIATAMLGVLQFVFAVAPTFTVLLGVRTVQAILYPAIFTAAVTYCSRQGERDAVASRIALYIATTIVGGLGGRLIGGYVSSWTQWSTTFQLLGTLLLLCSAGLFFAARDASLPAGNKGATWSAARAVLSDKSFLSGYMMIFLVFFTFAATLNVLPFRMVEVDSDVSASSISLLYLGYIVGVVIAVFIKPLTQVLGGRINTLAMAIVFFLTGLSLYSIKHVGLMIAVGFLVSAGMFTIHTTLSGYLNSLKPESASLVNGLYISIYYSAGALGSILPVAVYHSYGWQVFLGIMFVCCAASIMPLVSLRQAAQRGVEKIV